MEYSIREVAEMLIKVIQGTDDFDKWITYIEDRPFNDQRYYISNEKLRDLGWGHHSELRGWHKDAIVDALPLFHYRYPSIADQSSAVSLISCTSVSCLLTSAASAAAPCSWAATRRAAIRDRRSLASVRCGCLHNTVDVESNADLTWTHMFSSLFQ